MKRNKLLLALIIAVMAIVLSLVVVACDGTQDPTHEHSYSNWVITVAPTATEVGSATKVCTCGDIQTAVLPVLTDTSVWTVETTPATHAAAGSNVYTSQYGTVTVTLSPVQHVYDQQVATEDFLATPASCTAKATYYYSCTCGATGTETFESGKLLPHQYGTEWVTSETKHWKECTCGAKSEEGDHTFGNWIEVTAAQIGIKGEQKHICSVCNYEESEEIPALTHTHVYDQQVATEDFLATPASCTAKATYYYSCTCGATGTETFESGDLLPHQYGTEWVTSETKHWKECTCGAKSEEADHAFDQQVVNDTYFATAATCTAKATYYYSCTCGYKGTTTFENGDTLGHQFGEWEVTTDPTVSAVGVRTRYCSRTNCEESESEDIPALNDTQVWTKTCTSTYNAAGEDIYTSDVYGTYKVAAAKLVAPYDNKVYSSVNFDAEEESEQNKVTSASTSWSSATLALDAKGEGQASAFPFRGYTIMTVVDEATGEVNMRKYDLVKDTESEEYVKGETYTDYKGFVDFESGIMILCRNASLNDIHFCTPFEVVSSSANFVASNWKGNFAIAYTYNTKTYTAYVTDTRVYFGVSFKDANGSAISADACYNASQLNIYDGEELIVSLGYNGETMVELDGYQGTYTANDNTLVISGYGTLTYNGNNGTYNQAAFGAGYVLDAYFYTGDVAVGYAQIGNIDSQAGTATLVYPTATVTFESNEQGTTAPEATAYNINVKATLPTMENTATRTFKGWSLGGEIVENFVPTEDITLTAVFADKVVVNVINSVNGNTVIYLGEGDVIGEYLTPGTNSSYKFIGWYIDTNANGELDEDDEALPEEAEVTAEDSNITVIAKWEEIPPYVGSYVGSEIWNASYGNAGGKSLTISETGAISGLKTGTIVSYDKATQTIVWNNGTTNYKFYFDEATGIILGMYNNNDIDNDYYYFTKDTASSGKVKKQYGVYTNKFGSTEVYNYYAQFLVADTLLGNDTLIFTYNNKIYSNVTIKTTTGDALVVDSSQANAISKATTLVVYDSESNIIFAQAAATGYTIGDSTNTSTKKPQALDSYFGTYSNGSNEIVLDGTGKFVYGAKTGTYTFNTDHFDMYVVIENVNTEYYYMTIEGSSFQITKPMVTITLQGVNASVENIGSVNKNIAVALPTDLTAAAYFFRGWYVEGDTNQTLVDNTYIPTIDVTLVAKWDTKYTLTVVYGNTLENAVIYYGAGDTTAPVEPAYTEGKVFDHWYTSTDGGTTEDAVYTPALINGDLTIYCAWSNPPKYFNTYYGAKMFGYSTEASVFSNNAITFDAKGNGTPDGDVFKKDESSYKNCTVKIEYVDEATGKIKITNHYVYISGYSTKTETPYDKVYYGVIDSETGIIVINTSDGENASLISTWVLVPSSAKLTSAEVIGASASNWNSQKTKVLQVIKGEVTTGIFYNNGIIYTGVTFEDAEGTAVNVKTADKATMLIIKDRNAQTLFTFGYNGTTMVELDGNQGTYTLTSADSITVSGSGSVTLNSVTPKTGIYTVKEGNLEVYFQEGGVNTEFAIVTLDKGNKTYTITYPQVTISYSTEYASAPTSATVNKNIVYTVAGELEDAANIFVGWYVQGDAKQTIVTSITPTADTVLVAKWAPKVALTVVYGNGIENEILYYGVGDTTAPVKPKYTNGKAFDHWYTSSDNGVTEDAVYTESAISANLTIYCAWIEAVEQIGTYRYANVYGNTDTDRSWSNTFTVNANGTTTAGTIDTTDCAAGTFKLVNGTKTSYFAFDSTYGLMARAYSEGNTTGLGTDMNVYVLNADSNVKIHQYLHLGDAGKQLFIYQTAGVSYYGLVYDNMVYGNVTWTSTDGTVTAANVSKASDVTFYRAGTKLFTLKKVSGTFVKQDAFGGTYTDGVDDLIIDGYGKLTFGANNGTYTQAAAGSAYTLDAFITEGDTKVYYEVTLTGGEFSLVKRMYTVTVDLDGKGTMENFSINANVDYSLSSLVPTYAGYVFKGWYLTKTVNGETTTYGNSVSKLNIKVDTTIYAKWAEAYTISFQTDFGTAPLSKVIEKDTWCYASDRPSIEAAGHVFNGWYVSTDANKVLVTAGYKVTADTTFVALWVDEVTLTIVYGNDMENGTMKVGAGNKFSLTSYVPAMKNNLVFEGWFEEDTFDTAFTDTAITADKTIYCKWKTPSQFYGTYLGANLDPSETADAKETKTNSVTLVVDAEGKFVSGPRAAAGNPSTYDSTTGAFAFTGSSTYNGSADPEHNILYYDYTTSKTTPYHDIYVFVKTVGDVSLTGFVDSAWENGCTKLIEATMSDSSTLKIFIYNRKIYGGVTFVAKDASEAAITSVGEVYTANTVDVYDCNGNWIAGFDKVSGKLTYTDARNTVE